MTDNKKVRSKKSKTVVEGPKKNLSAYLHFCKDERITINGETKSDGSKYENKDIVSEMGARWKKLSTDNPERLEYYRNVAKDDEQRYKTELAVFKDSQSLVVPSEEVVPCKEVVEETPKKGKSSTKKTDAPKKPKNTKKARDEVDEDLLVDEDDSPVSVEPSVEVPEPKLEVAPEPEVSESKKVVKKGGKKGTKTK